MEDREKIKSFVYYNYKMRYAKDKRGFWVIVNYQHKKYYGFLEETILRNAINENKVDEVLGAIIENITAKIQQKQATNINTNEG